MNESIFKKVQTILETQLGVEKDSIKPDSRFREDLGADSLDEVELIMAMEEEFDTDIDDVEAENLTTVQALVSWLEANAA